ncbi:hypothetical protein EJP67_28810 [Variovorax guangxiensis]|uniref:Uncharacterized protein n=1 Tax=Variovorax guangxiensis TaxID=1775474 RepID=A0A3S0Z8I2_9BURK|nr:hypothetical protein [Variovorax guangxiensis]RUR71062.1 hypothetical protein EJP67_28810 [Variovorax guangxiensis]
MLALLQRPIKQLSITILTVGDWLSKVSWPYAYVSDTWHEIVKIWVSDQASPCGRHLQGILRITGQEHAHGNIDPQCAWSLARAIEAPPSDLIA